MLISRSVAIVRVGQRKCVFSLSLLTGVWVRGEVDMNGGHLCTVVLLQRVQADLVIPGPDDNVGVLWLRGGIRSIGVREGPVVDAVARVRISILRCVV